jgi:hypothetical protein
MRCYLKEGDVVTMRRGVGVVVADNDDDGTGYVEVCTLSHYANRRQVKVCDITSVVRA